MRGPADLRKFEEENTSITFRSPDDVDPFLDNQNLTPRERRNVERWRDKWRTELGQQHRDRINTHGATISEEATRHNERIANGRREINEILVAVKSGRMSAVEARRKIRKNARQHGDALKTQEALVKQAQTWEASLEQDPAAADAERRTRFSALGAGRTLTAAIIRGEVDED